MDVAYVVQQSTVRPSGSPADSIPVVRLGDIATLVQYGSSALAHVEPTGYPMLRMNNLQDDGWDLRDIKFVEMSPLESERYRLVSGDILINRTNGSRDLVGKSQVFRESGHWVFASYLIRVRVDPKVADPDYVSIYLNSEPGRRQILRSSRQILMSNVNSTELRSLQIPLPALQQQTTLAREVTNALRDRQALRAQSNLAFSQLSGSVLDELGIHHTIGGSPAVAWSVALRTLRLTGRLDALASSPDRVTAIEAIERAADRSSGTLRAVPLGEVASMRRELLAAPEGRFLGLANVESDTGQIAQKVDEASQGAVSQALRYQRGDVLYGRLRPYLNKVHLATSSGACSPEFIVLSPGPEVMPEFLANVMRTSAVVDQAKQLIAGNTLPRVSANDVSRLLLPVPDLEWQRRLCERVEAVREQALESRRRSKEVWESAARSFDAALRGGREEYSND